MTYTDIETQFADAGSVVGVADKVILVGSNYMDLGSTTNYTGDESTLFVRVRCVTRMITAGTPSTITFHVVSDANTSFNDATTGDPVLAECTTHASSLAIITDDATALDTGNTAGTPAQQSFYHPNNIAGPTQTPILQVKLPPGTYERYLGILAVIGAAAATTAGAVDADLVHDLRQVRHYPSALT